MFRLGLKLKMRFIAMPVVSWSGILVKKTSHIVRNTKFFERFAFLIWETKEKVYLQE